MNLYWCEYKDDDWGCLVVTTGVGLAKSKFYNDEPNYDDYINIRCRILARDVDYEPGLYDDDTEPWTWKWWKIPVKEDIEL